MSTDRETSLLPRAVCTLLLSIAIACGGAEVERASTAPRVSASAPASPPSAAAAPAAPALPRCPVLPAGDPVSFVDGGTTGVSLLPRSEALRRVEGALSDWVVGLGEHSIGNCYVVRSDGELMAFVCDSSYFTGNGGVRGGPSQAFVFGRAANGWQLLTLDQMLPAVGGGLLERLDGLCEERKSAIAPSALGLAPAEPGDNWLSVIVPASEGLELGVDWGRDEPTCLLPYAALAPLMGCGPLSPLARPELRIDPPADRPAALAVTRVVDTSLDLGDWHFPRFSGRAPRLAAIAAAINRDLDAWRSAAAGDRPFNLQCDVTMSTELLLSVVCSSGDSPAAPPRQTGMTYRLSDGSRVQIEDVFASNPAAVALATKRCVGEHVRKRKDDGDEALDKLPVWTAARFSAFGLGESSVRFVVPFEPTTRKGERRHRTTPCHLRYSDLRTTPEAIARPR